MTKSRERTRERDFARVQPTSVESVGPPSVCTESAVTCRSTCFPRVHAPTPAQGTAAKAVSCRRVGGRYSRSQETAHHGNNRHQTTTTQNETRPLRGKFVLFTSGRGNRASSSTYDDLTFYILFAMQVVILPLLFGRFGQSQDVVLGCSLFSFTV